MPFKTLIVSLSLSLLPAVSFAMCSGHEQQAQSCAQGMVWDSEQQACIDQASS